MAKFELCFRGQNFLIEKDGKRQKTGFHVARGISAPTMSDATKMAMDSFKADLGDKVFNEKGDPPDLKVVEAVEVYYFQDELHIDELIVPTTGYLWDEDKPEEVAVADKLSNWSGGWSGLRQSVKDGDLHTHTMLIHFTNALYPVAVLFIILSLVFGNESFAKAYFYIILLATVSSPISYLTGILEWKRRHQGAMIPIFAAKIRYGLLVSVIGAASAIWYFFSPELLLEPGILTVPFVILNLAVLPVILYLGHLGGTIVYEGAGEAS